MNLLNSIELYQNLSNLFESYDPHLYVHIIVPQYIKNIPKWPYIILAAVAVIVEYNYNNCIS